MNSTFSAYSPEPRVPPASRQDFVRLAEPHRRELQVHCYRMLGSLQDAEDLVQETMLRAWQKLDTYDARAPFRAWLYKIATNACLDALDRRPKRTLPPTRTPALTQPGALPPPVTEPIWLEPFPDDWLAASQDEPHARYASYESITLAFLAALQFLTPRQRAVLILADVLEWELAEIAALLQVSLTAVNSTLYRARITTARHYSSGDWEEMDLQTDASTRPILDRFVRVWEKAEIGELVQLLAQDAQLAMPPSPAWFQGSVPVQQMIVGLVSGSVAAGGWRLVPVRANGQPAFAMYQPSTDGPRRAMGITLVQARNGKIQNILAFLDPALFHFWNLPLTDEL